MFEKIYGSFQNLIFSRMYIVPSIIVAFLIIRFYHWIPVIIEYAKLRARDCVSEIIRLFDLFPISGLTVKDKNYLLTYYHGKKRYRVFFTKKIFINKIVKVIGDGETDITKTVLEFMGPNGDFHKMNLHPHFFGHCTLTFHRINGTKIQFDHDEYISVEKLHSSIEG